MDHTIRVDKDDVSDGRHMALAHLAFVPWIFQVIIGNRS